MKIGSPRESKAQEFRVGLTPAAVRQLVEDGNEVFIEQGAGAGINASDTDYENAGASLVEDYPALLQQAELIVKVKEPNAEERTLLTPGHCLFTYLHLASDPEQASDLLASGATCIAYETITDADGHLPLLRPMSEIAGRLAVQAAAHHLEKHKGGRGVLLSGATGVDPARVVIVGGGIVGSNACRIATALGASVTILDTSEARLAQLREEFPAANCLLSSAAVLAEQCKTADLLVGAVLIPGSKASKLITADMVRQMQAGAVIADVAIDQGGCCENSRPTTHAEPTFIKDGVVHYCVANIPGAVPLTASEALNNASLPVIRRLARDGIRQTLASDANLLNGLNVCAGKLTRPEIARDLGMEYTKAEVALASLRI